MEECEYRQLAEEWLKAIRNDSNLKIADFLEQHVSEAERKKVLEEICGIVTQQLIFAESALRTAREISEKILGR